MRPKLIATDLDGTFLDQAGHFDTAHFDAQLAALARHEIRFVVTTGDPLDHVQALFAPLKQRSALTYIVEDGALTVTGQGQQLQSQAIGRAQWQDAVRWLKTAPVMAGCFVIVCGRDRAYTELAADSQRFHDSQAFYPSLTSVPDLTQIVDEILKIDVTWLKTDVVQQVVAFNRQFQNQLVGTSSGLGGMNVTLPLVSKASALLALGQLWGVLPDQMAAFGDSGNDQAMLSMVGQGFAVANADPAIITGSIRRLPLTNQQGVVSQQIDEWLV
ncbi:HAD-IIB family hydrolase [Levilactobacillus tujiorum]|uniref:HAD-IIB family hydrolase n=1 Tax=Levilactobacillus tujiorum TaxID=2912243 RepID=A0ABX1L7P8_9LACO|nr:HAD-IIB family hydrolase [Levilactobacillus tujiorum]MCH5465401.1 HAD-IIB family hydrolase [Levilactobacillus tujiorum]NLR12352.1 HAD-IIB family hydrolase [Lactobacillus sp. HBUAS51387]NLR30404.1 HAD-IIB family hydrolase [Levilactobacillus tujiorum]